MEVLTGDTPDISNFTDLTLYSRVWVWKHRRPRNLHDPVNGSASPMISVLVPFLYWVMDKRGQGYARTSIQCVMDDELIVDTTKKLFDDMDVAINATLGGDQHFKNVQMAPDQYAVEHASDDVPEPMFGNFLPDVDEI
jgi:hypothetical protein